MRHVSDPAVLYVEDDPNDIRLMRYAWARVGVTHRFDSEARSAEPGNCAEPGAVTASLLRYLAGNGFCGTPAAL